jgi:hypothetical protein
MYTFARLIHINIYCQSSSAGTASTATMRIWGWLVERTGCSSH